MKGPSSMFARLLLPYRIVAKSAILVLAMAIVADCRLSLRSACAQVATKGKAAEALADSRAADRAAIAATLESLAKAFESRDPQALAACWTSEGEYENESGTTVQGRD